MRIAGRRENRHTFRDRILKRRYKSVCFTTAAEAHINHVSSIVGRVTNRVLNIRVVSALAIVAEHIEHHNFRKTHHTRATEPVACSRGSESRNVSPVRLISLVLGARDSARKIVTVHVVDISIQVIIDSIRWDLALVDPQIRLQVFVLHIDTCVDDRYHHGP